MDKQVLKDEQANADETISYLCGELAREMGNLSDKRDGIKDIYNHMWSDYSNVRLDDKERLNELAQYLTQLNQNARSADATSKLVAKYERLLDSPYFGRFDLVEKGMSFAERIYIGFHNLFDLKKGRVYIYDWRSPIASVYYRFELGQCYYQAPDGRVEGEVLLKRQLKFVKGILQYYGDSGLVIRDEILLEALSKSSTAKMKTIVETIQKEQDMIIRDLKSGALMVNGVAGSGKTSIALHRIAYLLYEHKITGVTHKNIIALSPSDAFADYIDDVLPNLGEERIKQITIDDVYAKIIKKMRVQTKNQYLERLMGASPAVQRKRIRSAAFKSSRTMAEVLDRYALLYERKIHKFSDIFLNGRVIITSKQLKALFLDNNAKLPALARLKRIRDRVTGEALPVFDIIRGKIKEIVKTCDKWAFEEDRRTDELLAKIKNRFFDSLNKQTSIEPTELYIRLTGDAALWERLSKGLSMPSDASEILSQARGSMRDGFLPYGDAAAVLYLTERLHGIKQYGNVRHVVIDEAQDYGAASYLTFKRMFPNARYTILGDVNQAVGRRVPHNFFRRVAHHMRIPQTATLSLRKSYRSSVEIQDFCNRILGRNDAEAFDRKGIAPQVITGNRSELIKHITDSIKTYGEGRTCAILTKTAKEAKTLAGLINIKGKTLITAVNEKLSKTLNIMPVYMSKGLEFDFVMVWGADARNYKTPFDRNILYVACTRALHRLHVYAEDAVSRFI